MLKVFISRISSKHDFNCFCHICHYFLDIKIPFNWLMNLLLQKNQIQGKDQKNK